MPKISAHCIINLLLGVLLIAAIALYGQAAWIYAKAQVAQNLIASAWEETLDTGSNQRPWDWADTWPVARLQHLESGTDLYILEGAQGNSLAFGPGHQHGTASPGEEGSSLIGGHRDTHFRFLKEAQLRDELRIQNHQGEWITYEITRREVHHIDQDQLNLAQDLDQLVLVTCFPFDSLDPGGPLRLVIFAHKKAPRQEIVGA